MKLEGKVKAMSEELKKGNEIIKKLQAEIKNYHSKVRQQFLFFFPFVFFRHSWPLLSTLLHLKKRSKQIVSVRLKSAKAIGVA